MTRIQTGEQPAAVQAGRCHKGTAGAYDGHFDPADPHLSGVFHAITIGVVPNSITDGAAEGGDVAEVSIIEGLAFGEGNDRRGIRGERVGGLGQAGG